MDGVPKLDVDKMIFFLSQTEENADHKDLYGGLLQFCAPYVGMIPERMGVRLKPSWILSILESDDADVHYVQENLIPHCLLSHAGEIDEEMRDELLGFVNLGEDLSPQGFQIHRFASRVRCVSLELES